VHTRQIDPHDPKTWANIKHCQPGHEFVYRLRDAEGRLLYVGITWSAKARWDKHRAKKAWWAQVASVDIQCYPDERSALAAELEAIHAEHPIHNIRGVVSR